MVRGNPAVEGTYIGFVVEDVRQPLVSGQEGEGAFTVVAMSPRSAVRSCPFQL